MATECDRVFDWLNQQWRIQCPRDWLEACVEWLQGENQGRRLVHKELCDQVLEQWLLADLSEVGASCLPPDCNQAKVVLEGSYCLQVNSVLDVGCPIYGQIQKVEGTENANVHISASQFSQTQEPKAGRMLMFEMTDGSQAIRGMEYQTLPGFDVSMEPGTKVLVQGPVLCRHGVLMLSRQSLTLLGGEVEGLKEDNSQLAVLRQKLAQQSGDQGQRPPLPREKYKSEPQPKPRSRRDVTGPQPPSHGSMMCQDEDFPDDLDPTQLAGLEDQWDDSDMDELLLSSAVTAAESSDSRPRGARNMTSDRPTPDIGHPIVIKPEPQPSVSDMNPIVIKPEISQQNSSRTAHGEIGRNYSNRSGQNQVPNGQITDDMNMQTPGTWQETSHGDTQNHSLQKQSGSSLGHHTCMSSIQQSVTQSQPPVRLTSAHSRAQTSLSNVPESDLMLVCEDEDDWMQPQQMLKHGKSEKIYADLYSAPYTFLRLLEEVWPVKSRHIIRVKAFVSTLLSRLEHNEGRFWSLKVKINDGTATVDVTLSDQMLTSLIGFTAQECHVMKEKAKQNKDIRLKIATGLKRCQQSLIQLSCILELDVSPGEKCPTVLQQVPVSPSDVASLQNRIKHRH